MWWLVSPQNPLKPADGMAPFAARLADARRLARPSPAVRVTDIEARLGTRYTVDTLEALTRAMPSVRYVWLMGADNLAQIPRWRRWQRIFELVPVAVFGRAPYSLRALSGQAARRYARQRRRQRDAARIVGATPPAWVFILAQLHPASGTALRTMRLGRSRARR